MVPTVGGNTCELTRFEPFAFDGGAAASCGLPLGPTRDLNIRTSRGRCHATVEVIDVDGSTTCHLPGDGAHLLVALTDQITARR
jgi:environmental stress-induced protein Ves